MKEVRITFAEVQTVRWNDLCTYMVLRQGGIDPRGDLMRHIDYRDMAVVYRQPETEDDYKNLGIF